MTKHCFYCDGDIHTKTGDYERRGKRYVCAFCWEEYAEEFEQYDPSNDEEED